jgi:general secretion pathway protein H
MTIKTARGFTLLELMVVILIIGVIVTFASLSIGDRALDDRLEAEAKRLEQLLRLAEEEADLKGAPLGLSFTVTGYRFLVADRAHGWTDYAKGGVLRSRDILPPFYTELHVEDRLIPPAPAAAERGKDDKAGAKSEAEGGERDAAADAKNAPQVLLLPGGQMTPFTLDLKAPNYGSWFRIEGDALGRLKRTRLFGNRDGRR